MMMEVIRKLKRKSAAKKQSVQQEQSEKTSPAAGNPEELFSLIEKKAYEFYEKRGRTEGNDLIDWYEAEKAVMESSDNQK